MALRMLVILLLSAAFCSGCSVTSVKVTTRNAPTRRPASRILVVYLDEGCDLSRFDSNLYNICLKSCFRNAASLELRTNLELLMGNSLATPGLTIINATDLFDTANNGYTYFMNCIEKYGIDAIFVAEVRGHLHVEREYLVSVPVGGAVGAPVGGAVMEKRIVLDGTFAGYLFFPGSIGLPVWTADAGGTGSQQHSGSSLDRAMAKKVAAALRSSGYITR
jgi:hypothetical protein